jgi:hypothetical protein
MSTHFPKPFWKKRYREDSSESSTQQTHDKLKPTIKINGDKAKSEDESEDANNSNSSSTEQTLETQAKRRKVEKCTDDTTYVGKEQEAGDGCVTEYHSSHLNEDINKRRSKDINVYEKQRSNDSSHRSLTRSDTSPVISTDSGLDSRGSD